MAGREDAVDVGDMNLLWRLSLSFPSELAVALVLTRSEEWLGDRMSMFIF